MHDIKFYSNLFTGNSKLDKQFDLLLQIGAQSCEEGIGESSLFVLPTFRHYQVFTLVNTSSFFSLYYQRDRFKALRARVIQTHTRLFHCTCNWSF